jgi:ribosomal protein S18 acetylase RimI-like enzyme
MKNRENLITANWDNLTSLWKKAATPFRGHVAGDVFDYAAIRNTDWPNRLWFHEDITQESVEKALEIIESTASRLTIPYRDIYNTQSNRILEENGFAKTFEQVAMSLPLTSPFQLKNQLDFSIVSNPTHAEKWASIYPSAFGYRISGETLLRSMDTIRYILATKNNQPVGTAILHQTGPIAGVHGVGVIPEMRRKGWAEELMKFALNMAIDAGAEDATLQASAMGKGLYLKMGFEEQFILYNYVKA